MATVPCLRLPAFLSGRRTQSRDRHVERISGVRAVRGLAGCPILDQRLTRHNAWERRWGGTAGTKAWLVDDRRSAAPAGCQKSVTRVSRSSLRPTVLLRGPPLSFPDSTVLGGLRAWRCPSSTSRFGASCRSWCSAFVPRDRRTSNSWCSVTSCPSCVARRPAAAQRRRPRVPLRGLTALAVYEMAGVLRHARDAASLAPQAGGQAVDLPEVGSGSSAHRRRSPGFHRAAGKGEPPLGLPVHPR